jgi:hypothetical protein
MANEARKIRDEKGGSARPVPEVSNRQVSREFTAGEEMSGGVAGCPAFRTEVIVGLSDGVQIRLQAVTIVGSQLMKGAAVSTSESIFFRVDVRWVET